MPKPTHPRSPGGFALDLLAAPFVPVIAIRRSWRAMGLLPAYGVHVLGLLLALVVFVILDFATYGTSYFVEGLAYEFEYAFSGSPDDGLLIGLAMFVLSVIFFESGYLVTAWVLMPWGASPEPWRRSMNRGLVRLLQLTPFHAISLVVIIFVVDWIDSLGGYSYSRGWSSSGSSSGLSWDERQFFQAICIFIYLASQVVVTLWAFAIHRDRPRWAAHCPWPAVCEGCGYQLVGMSAGQSCPECGVAIDQSFDTPRSKTDPRNVFVKMFQATIRPCAFGKTIPLYRPTTGYRKALWVGVGLLAATPALGFFIVAVIASIEQGEVIVELEDLFEGYGSLCFIYVLTLGYSVIVSLALGLLGATLWGAYARVIRKRNALYPAAQAFAYQSGFFAFWALGYYPLVALVIIVVERSWNYYGPTPMWIDFLPAVFALYTLVMMAVGFTLQGRLLAGARYGNG